MQRFAHFDCNNQVLLSCSFTYISLPFFPILNVFIIVDFPCSCNGIPLTSFLRFYKFTEGNKFSNVLDILKSNLLYINQGLNTLSQSFSAKSLPYLHALSHAQNIITRGINYVFNKCRFITQHRGCISDNLYLHFIISCYIGRISFQLYTD